LLYQEQLEEKVAAIKIPFAPPQLGHLFFGWRGGIGFVQVFYFLGLLNFVGVRVCVILGSIICVCGKRIFGILFAKVYTFVSIPKYIFHWQHF